MLTKRQKKILAAYEMFDDDDVSTERLFAMVEDYTGADAGEISAALYAAEMEAGSADV